MNIDTAEWIKASEDDLEVARLAFDGGKYNHVVVLCQQAIEKRLKGLIVEKTGQMPPRIHSLTELAAQAGAELCKDVESLFIKLGQLYIAARYPMQESGVLTVQTEEDARHYIGRAEEVVEWVDQQITQLSEQDEQ